MDDLPLPENDLHAIVCSISKNGDFFLAQGELAEAARSLSPEQSVRLYEHIRDSADRLEFEWRDEFLEAFPGSEHLLPKPLL
ncbi:hypothetical protein [Dyella sp. 2HG41-7]|uniref:hypothetical protein n=1 Tax=Dyella sp. 2HG41-7 TaxID=2883239 RepID=UPI001F3FAADC|nr:hypothetical protein [Dyella sp. 2HG41-7]